MPHTPTVERLGNVQAEEFAWPHEIQVALPASYASTDRSYPVLWVTDGSIMFDLATAIAHLLSTHGQSPELIVVGVGCTRDADPQEFARRRNYEFAPIERRGWSGSGWRERQAGLPPLPPGGGAEKFLAFIADPLRSELSQQYRMQPDAHALFGCSMGGLFVGYTLFSRPDAFASYICGSPVLSDAEFRVFALEEELAASRDDLNTSLFLGAGEAEVLDLVTAAYDVTGSLTRMAQIMALRGYPSLRMACRIYPRTSHVAAPPAILTDGIQFVFADA